MIRRGKEKSFLDNLLSYKRTRLSLYVDKEHISRLKKAFLVETQKKDKAVGANETEAFVHFIFVSLKRQIEEAKKLRQLLKEFKGRWVYVGSSEEGARILLEYGLKFGSSKFENLGDAKALHRWFDEDALSERVESKISYIHRHCMVLLERLTMAIELLSQEEKTDEALWEYFDFNVEFLALLNYQEEPHLSHKIFKAFVLITQYFKVTQESDMIDDKLFRFIYKIALSPHNDVWIQNDALEFLASTKIDFFLTIAMIRSAQYKDDDTIFVRHKIATLSFFHLNKNPSLLSLIREFILLDPSPYVRQAIAKALPLVSHPVLVNLSSDLILRDNDPSVRALALTKSLVLSRHTKTFESLLWESLLSEKNPFVLKTALFCLGKRIEQNIKEPHIDSSFVHYSLVSLSELLLSDLPLSLKRYTAMRREFIWVCSDKTRYRLYIKLRSFVENINVGKGKRLPKIFYKGKEEEVYRILSVIAQEEFSLELKRTLWHGYILYRGERFRRRWWRIWYEMLNPSPDKREGFVHTVARIFEGTRHFPSSIMAEQAQTKVPAEPYLIPEEESWRPYVPLPDHFLSSLTQDSLKIHPYRLYTAKGLTQIKPPRFFLNRMRLFWSLSFRYGSIAPLRNWRESSTKAPNSYIKAMEKLGFQVTFSPYVPEDKSTTKFFSLALPIPFLAPDTQASILNYFISAYENTLGDLVLFIVGIFGFFFVRHIVLSYRIRNARKRIPLSIGGWGTRGKSGTERLKAALFNALGLKVFSKTTGNEAMFLHSDSFDTMREMYLFRPYDKATIWEQADTVLLADKLHVDIYLWESMGLTPSYVNILQQQWMKDNIATITNTYPDHENLQGPAGINIPQVMTNFIPPDSILVTTEEVMYPILKDYAKSVHTRSISTGWLQAGLIAPDILSRFPYEEHPHNIALVLGMANELDIDEDEALKAMADNIVPDLGVLKAYPIAEVAHRKLRFINGMSANERFGALGNWKRMGLAHIDDEKEPHIFLSTVINNRADRVSRSRVFASMVVEDIVADCHILIGSNLSGLQSYIEEAWIDYKQALSLDATPTQTSLEKLTYYAHKFRIMRTSQQLKKRLELMISPFEMINKEIVSDFEDETKIKIALEKYPEIWNFYHRAKKEYDAYLSLVTLCEKETNSDKLNGSFRDFLWRSLKSRIIPIANYHATGNEVIQTIIENTPIGMQNTIIGMQNIKGTGLDFAYRWVAWNECYLMCQSIQSQESQTIRQGVDALANFNAHGPLSLLYATQSVAIAKKSMATQNEYQQSQIQRIEHTLEEAKLYIATLSATQTVATLSRYKRWLHKTLEVIEAFLDAGDAVKRRKKANRIYKDLVNFHISHKRASVELQKITKRQKGGWFVQEMEEKWK